MTAANPERWAAPNYASFTGTDATPLQQTFQSLSAYLEKINNSVTIASGAGVASLSGTTNQVSVSGATGAITISFPTNLVLAGNVSVPANGKIIDTANANYFTPKDQYGNMYHKLTSGSFYVDSNNYYFRNQAASATLLAIDSSGITVTGSLDLTGNATRIRQNSTSTWSGDAGAGFGKFEYHSNRWYINAGSDSTEIVNFRRGPSSVASLNNSGGLQAYSIQGNSNVAGTGNASYHPSGIYATNTNNWLYGNLLTNGGTVGIPSQYCGAMYSNNWFRSSGITGWYNESYGGGIYMEDTTYVRVYNGKYMWAPSYTGAVQYGSFGSITIRNAAGGYAGIATPEMSSTVMWYYDVFGHYKANSFWNFYVTNGTFVSSDERWKRNIVPMKYGMDFVNALEPIEYQRLTQNEDDPEETLEPEIYWGFTSQQVFRALDAIGETREVKMVNIGGPPVLEENKNDRQYLNATEMLAPIIKALQELDQRLSLLEGTV